MRFKYVETVFGFFVITSCAHTTPRPLDEAASKTTLPSSLSRFRPHEQAFLEQYALTYRFRLGHPKQPTVTPNGDAVIFTRSAPRSFVHNLYQLDVKTGNETVLFSADAMLQGELEQLSPEERAQRERMRVASRGVVNFQLSSDGTRVLVPFSGRLYVIDRETKTAVRLVSPSRFPLDPQFSPDGKKVAFVSEGDVQVLDLLNGVQSRLTRRGNTDETYGLAEFIAQEEMGRHRGFWWSPDSRTLVVQQTNSSGIEARYLADPFHPEAQPEKAPYPRPGKQNAEVRLFLISLDEKKLRPIEWDHAQFPYLVDVVWSERSPLTLVVQNRKQSEMNVMLVDAKTGVTQTIWRETDAAWLNIDNSVPVWINQGTEWLWSTERNGFSQLELRRGDGSLVRELTSLDFGYRKLVHVDEAKGCAYVLASREPTEQALYCVALHEGVSPRRLSTDSGWHQANFGEGHHLFVEERATLDAPRQFWVRSMENDAQPIALKSASETPLVTPHVEILTIDHPRKFRAAVLKPRQFNPRKKYPVIVYVYGGPTDNEVKRDRSSYWLHQWFAEQGFVVVTIDGRGTPFRGREWERTIRGNFIDAPLQDQTEGLRALGTQLPYLDLSRVGIFGWSFGGYFSTMAVLREPNVFHAAVAGAPVSEWLDYDTHYTERYLGLPNDNVAGYRSSSSLTYAPQLTRPLMIVHGTADDNVYFVHALKLSHALFRSGIPHHVLQLAEYTHMVADPIATKQLYSRIAQFFVENLVEK